MQESVKEKEEEDDGKVLQEAVKKKEEEVTGKIPTKDDLEKYTSWEKAAMEKEKREENVKKKGKKEGKMERTR